MTYRRPRNLDTPHDDYGRGWDYYVNAHHKVVWFQFCANPDAPRWQGSYYDMISMLRRHGRRHGLKPGAIAASIRRNWKFRLDRGWPGLGWRYQYSYSLAKTCIHDFAVSVRR